MDFSDHGIGLSVSEPISRGEQFILKIKLPELVLLVFTVRCCVPDARRYRIGAEFYGIVGSPNDDAETSRAKFVARLEAAAATPVR
jgi:hypothetical protein